MLRANLWVEKGLVNGSLGYIRDIIYEPGTAPPNDVPLAIMVEFDNYSGPTIANNLVPIPAILKSWKVNGRTCTRKQFPIQLAYAITIHKSQGLSLDKAIVNIGDNEKALGLTYVALSRVKSLEGLAFEKAYDLTRFTRISSSKQLKERLREESRLINL
jgi:ATP-dependent DNA helicase PIF1